MVLLQKAHKIRESYGSEVRLYSSRIVHDVFLIYI